MTVPAVGNAMQGLQMPVEYRAVQRAVRNARVLTLVLLYTVSPSRALPVAPQLVPRVLEINTP